MRGAVLDEFFKKLLAGDVPSLQMGKLANDAVEKVGHCGVHV